MVAAAAAAKTETMLKKTARKAPKSLHNKQAAKTRLVKAKLARGAKQVVDFKRLETLYRETSLRSAEISQLKAKAAQSGQIYVDGEPKLLLVVRIKGIRKIPHKARKTMQLLGLTRIHSARFIAANKATIAMLSAAEPYLAWGCPTLKMTRELIYKRGHADIHRQRVTIASNEIVARHLGQFNILCVEDLIREIFTVGENFKHACRFLSVFRLNSPRKGLVSKKRHFSNGGSFGNRGPYISDLVSRML